VKTVLITGGAGFIGSHLCDFFIDKGFRVICVDNLITGRIENIASHLSDKNFKFVKHDIIQPFKVNGPVDYVLHFASPASPKDYEKYPLETLKTGSIGTLNALEIARMKHAVFILASTSEVYGDPLVSPQDEGYFGNVNPVGPRSCYYEAKRFAEALTFNYSKIKGVDARIIRIFNTYGPRMKSNDGRVVPNFITQALRGKPLTVYGNGQQTRSFCYISDLVKAIYSLMLITRKNMKGERVINLGNPDEFTINEFSRMLLAVIGKKLKIKHLPLPLDDPRQRKPDIRRARAILKWRPETELREGLVKTIGWFRNN
jgi:nucleoside-diphosphate-sugar epimerase